MNAGNQVHEAFEPVPAGFKLPEISAPVAQAIIFVDQYHSALMRSKAGGISLGDLARTEAEELIASRDVAELPAEPGRMD